MAAYMELHLLRHRGVMCFSLDTNRMDLDPDFSGKRGGRVAMDPLPGLLFSGLAVPAPLTASPLGH